MWQSSTIKGLGGVAASDRGVARHIGQKEASGSLSTPERGSGWVRNKLPAHLESVSIHRDPDDCSIAHLRDPAFRHQGTLSRIYVSSQ